jgi:hypothetical protein
MQSQVDSDPDRTERPFAEQAESPPPGLVAEFWDFLRHNKKWWLTPIVLVLLALSVLVVLGGLGGGAATPFIYTLF